LTIFFSFFLFLFLFFSFSFFFTSTIQNTNSKQLNKNYIKITIIAPKQSGIYREHLLHHQNSVRQTSRAARQWGHVSSTRPLQWRRVGSRAAAKNLGNRVGLAQLLLLFPSLPAVRATATCKSRNTHKQQLILIFLSFWSKSVYIFLFSRSVSSLPLGLIFLVSMADLAVAVFCGRSWVNDDGWICGVQRAVVVQAASSVGGRRAAVGFCGGQPAGKREKRRRRRIDTGKRKSGRGLSVVAGRLRKERFGEGDGCVWA
jgi:hypothetical protein